MEKKFRYLVPLVCNRKMSLNSFWSKRAILFCLVVSILYRFFDLKSKVTEIYRSAGDLYYFFHSFPCRRI